jgi:transcriptional regulator with XRE-family HTH domain
MTDAKLLKSAMALNGLNQRELAEKMGISQMTLSNKMTNKVEFTASEIRKIADILGLGNMEVMNTFMN